MALQIEGAPPNLPPRRRATVARIAELTPRVRRLTLTGDDLAGFEPGMPGAHIKLILPPPGDTAPATPLRYEGRRAIFADGVTPPNLRTYTPLRFDPAGPSLEVELLLHGDGVASHWVRQASVGSEAIVAGPRGGWDVPQDGDWYLVLADDTAMPAAIQVLATLSARRAFTAFEVVDQYEERALPGVDHVTWLHRGEDPTNAGAELERHLAALELPGGNGYAWVACEATAMRRIRKSLIERGLPAERMVTRGYWKLGAPDHPDGDYGQD